MILNVRFSTYFCSLLINVATPVAVERAIPSEEENAAIVESPIPSKEETTMGEEKTSGAAKSAVRREEEILEAAERLRRCSCSRG